MRGILQHRRNTVGCEKMDEIKSSNKKSSARNTDEDWKEICKFCEIFRLYEGCEFGCELIKASLQKNKRKKNLY
jgi:hypothetical protein